MDKDRAIELLIQWANKLKTENKIHYSVQARRAGIPIPTYTAIRTGGTNASEETAVRSLHKLAQAFPELHDIATAEGIDVNDVNYTENEIVAALRDRLEAIERENEALVRENRELIKQLRLKKKGSG